MVFKYLKVLLLEVGILVLTFKIFEKFKLLYYDPFAEPFRISKKYYYYFVAIFTTPSRT